MEREKVEKAKARESGKPLVHHLIIKAISSYFVQCTEFKQAIAACSGVETVCFLSPRF